MGLIHLKRSQQHEQHGPPPPSAKHGSFPSVVHGKSTPLEPVGVLPARHMVEKLEANDSRGGLDSRLMKGTTAYILGSTEMDATL